MFQLAASSHALVAAPLSKRMVAPRAVVPAHQCRPCRRGQSVPRDPLTIVATHALALRAE